MILGNHQTTHRGHPAVLHELLCMRCREAKHLQLDVVGRVGIEHDLVDLFAVVQMDLRNGRFALVDDPYAAADLQFQCHFEPFRSLVL